MRAPAPPSPGGPPDKIPIGPNKGQVIPPGYPAPLPPPGRIYVSTQGDMWDLIAFRVFGMKRHDDHLLHKLIEANYALRDVCHFPAGLAVVVPDVVVKTEISLVPWKKAAQVTLEI